MIRKRRSQHSLGLHGMVKVEVNRFSCADDPMMTCPATDRTE